MFNLRAQIPNPPEIVSILHNSVPKLFQFNQHLESTVTAIIASSHAVMRKKKTKNNLLVLWIPCIQQLACRNSVRFFLFFTPLLKGNLTDTLMFLVRKKRLLFDIKNKNHLFHFVCLLYETKK